MVKTKHKFGSIEWQDTMIATINEKLSKGIELEAFEECFLIVQAEHNHRVLEGY